MIDVATSISSKHFNMFNDNARKDGATDVAEAPALLFSLLPEKRKVLDLPSLDLKLKELDLFKSRYMGEGGVNTFRKRQSALALHENSFVSRCSGAGPALNLSLGEIR